MTPQELSVIKKAITRLEAIGISDNDYVIGLLSALLPEEDVKMSNPEIPDSSDFHTFLDEGKSIMQMRKENPALFHNKDEHPWFEKEEFATKTEQPTTRRIRKSILPGSTNKTASEQKTMVESAGGHIPTSRQLLAMIIDYYKKTGERLYSTVWARSEEKMSAGYLAVVGNFVADGLDVSFVVAYAHSRSGASFSQ